MTKLQIARLVFAMLFGIAVLVALLIQLAQTMTWTVALVVGLVVVAFCIQGWYFKRRNERRGWRMRSVEKGEWAYEEKREGNWVGIPFAELGDPRKSPHVIGIPKAASWESFPAWASARREEIVARIKSELKAPEYTLADCNQSPEPPSIPAAPVPGSLKPPL